MAFKSGDTAWIVYQGPPRWDGEKWIDGDRFFLSGGKGLQLDLGVELAPGVSGLEAEVVEYRFDTSANVPGSVYVSEVAGRRTIQAPINILGKTARELRDNKRRWFRNHRNGEKGRLWAFTSEGEPRYLPVIRGEGAGLSTLDKDPGLRVLYEGFDWGWDSDSPYFMGYEASHNLIANGNVYEKTFYNPSTAPRVYPVLTLPGGCRWRIPLGGGETFVTMEIPTGEEARLDLQPRKPTFLKKNAEGKVENIWHSLLGNRPKLYLEPETRNHFSIEAVDGTPDKAPNLTFTPLFTSWV